jgi:predicted small lipoprotein YifL
MRWQSWLTALATAAAIAGCGQSAAPADLPTVNHKVAPRDSSVESGNAAFIECAKRQGATIPPGFNPRSKAALLQLGDAVNRACDDILVQTQPPFTEAERQAWLDYAQCMRDHGIPTNDPEFRPGAVSISFGKGVDRNSTAYRTANAECEQKVSGGPAPSAPGG